MTHRRCQEIYRDRFDFEAVRNLRLKGIEQPVTAFRVKRSKNVAPSSQVEREWGGMGCVVTEG